MSSISTGSNLMFSNSQDASIEILASVFGIAPVEVCLKGTYGGLAKSQLETRDDGVESGGIKGHGTIVNTIPGKFAGKLYYNDPSDLAPRERYRLDCTIRNKTLNMVFIKSQDHTPKGVFVSPLPDNNRHFEGIFQFVP
jgi:hypothetical protein